MKSSMKKTLMCIVMVSGFFLAKAQGDLLSELEGELDSAANFPVEATFKGTRLINGHTVETRQQGVLEFIISHRFGLLSSGSYNLWGLDQSNIRLALEYAPTSRLYIGAGRSSFEKTYDGFAKYRILRQSESGMPISITAFASTTIKTIKDTPVERTFSEKLAHTGQLLIARKFSPNFSMQLMPTLLFMNLVPTDYDQNTAFAIGAGGRYKVSKRVAINAEYYHQVQALASFTKNALALGVDIETGGHVFQLHLTNATSMIEKGFVGETINSFSSGDIHFGFNITRAFQVGKW